MAAVDMSSWGLSITPEVGVGIARGDAAQVVSNPDRALPPRRSRWQALGRILYAATLATAMTDPQIVAMLDPASLERAQRGR